MLERFTERSRRVLALAREEAGRLNHEYIGTEHLLLGLVAEGKGVAAEVLRRLGVDLEGVRKAVEGLVQAGPPGTQPPERPMTTPRARRALELAGEAARELGHPYIGTEHLLLGLLREGEGVAARALRKLGLDLETVRQATLSVLSAGTLQPGKPEGEGAERGETREEETLPHPVPQREIPWPEWVKEAVNAPEVLELERRMVAARAEKEAAAQEQDFERAARKRDEERALRAELPRQASLRSLRALLDRPDDPACAVLLDAGLDLEAVKRRLDDLLHHREGEGKGERGSTEPGLMSPQE